MKVLFLCIAIVAAGPVWATPGAQQSPDVSPVAAAGKAEAPPPTASVTLPSGYVIGPDDVLAIVFWRDKDMSSEATVRPDGKISLPLLNDVHAAGLTPEQLREQIVSAAAKYVAEPNATVVVKEIHSLKVFITGNVAKPGTYSLVGELNVLQLIALAGGLVEYADAKNIVVMRNEAGRQQSFKFNYKDVTKQKHLEQNITLKPGDTVVVP
jgi:polysaccharide biosynthesis/export protein